MWVSVEPELTSRLYETLKTDPIINELVGDRVLMSFKMMCDTHILLWVRATSLITKVVQICVRR